MVTEILRNIFHFALLVLLQALVINNINLGSYLIPLPYVMFILMLPFETPILAVLFSSLMLGLILDSFNDTQGIHAAACTLTGFSRIYVLNLFAPREGYDAVLKPTVAHMGLAWFASYTLILIFIHHFSFFFLEIFKFTEFFSTLFRTLLSTLTTFGFIYLFQFLFYRNKAQL